MPNSTAAQGVTGTKHSVDTDKFRYTDSSTVPRNAVIELKFTSDRDFTDPWSEIEVDVEFVDPCGDVRTVPAFWAGGRNWRVRYSSAREGTHTYRSRISSRDQTGLEDASGELEVIPYYGVNPLLVHGGPRVADDQRHLSYADGEPFFWLGDTWWSAMTARFRWPDIFQTLADDRAEKGFTVVQLVGGLVPEFVPWSPRMASEGGQPWEGFGKGKINPNYYTVPDRKIDYLVSKGIVPCIVGGWGFFSTYLGREGVMQHWRYLVARYAAYPVIWCIAGEVEGAAGWEALARIEEMARPSIIAPDLSLKERLDAIDPFKLKSTDWATQTEEAVRLEKEQVKIWEDASDLIAQIDPYSHIRTVHTMRLSSQVFSSNDSFDLDMQQTGHYGAYSVRSKNDLQAALTTGNKPALVGECSYEGIFDSNWHDMQRFMFWSSLLSGAAGHTYGNMPISCFNSKDDPQIPLSRVSMHYWDEAIDWPGAAHVATGKRILERFPWWKLQPGHNTIYPHASSENWFLPYAGKLPDGTIIIYQPSIAYQLGYGRMTSNKNEQELQSSPHLELRELDSATTYQVSYIDPRSGTEQLGEIFVPDDGRHAMSTDHFWATPTAEDWVVVVRPRS